MVASPDSSPAPTEQALEEEEILSQNLTASGGDPRDGRRVRQQVAAAAERGEGGGGVARARAGGLHAVLNTEADRAAAAAREAEREEEREEFAERADRAAAAAREEEREEEREEFAERERTDPEVLAATFARILGADTSWDVLGLSRESATEADIAEAIERLQSLQWRTVDYQSEHNAEQIKKKVCDAFVNLSGEAAREEYNEELDERADEAGAKVQAAPLHPPRSMRDECASGPQ